MIINWTYDDIYQSPLYFTGWSFVQTWSGATTDQAVTSRVKNIHIIHHRPHRRSR